MKVTYAGRHIELSAEQTGKLESMLERISDFLDEEIETTLSGLTSLIEPLLIVFLGVTVGGILDFYCCTALDGCFSIPDSRCARWESLSARCCCLDLE